MTMKPKRIIEKPEKIRRDGQSNYSYLIKCDNGETYYLPDLALAIGIDAQCLRIRVAKWGWNNAFILDPERGKKGQLLKNKPIDGDDADLRNLGSRIRTENLDRIPVGSWEGNA
jgi:hypothetical protein